MGVGGHNINTHENGRVLVFRERVGGIGCGSGEATGFSFKFESEGDGVPAPDILSL